MDCVWVGIDCGGYMRYVFGPRFHSFLGLGRATLKLSVATLRCLYTLPRLSIVFQSHTMTTYLNWRFTCHRNFHARTVKVDKWEARIYKTQSMMEDGVVLVPIVFEVASVYPVGLCECGKCGAYWIANFVDKMYWDTTNQRILCEDCKGNSLPMMTVYTTNTPKLRTDPDIVISYEDVINEAAGYALAQRLAVTRGLHYFDGKTVEDLYKDMLAKRAIRRWRRTMKRNLFQRTLWVLKTHLDLDISTCAGIARIAVQ